MKKIILSVLFGFLLSLPLAAGAAESNGYVFYLPPADTSLYAVSGENASAGTADALPDDTVEIGHGYYTTNDEAFIRANKNRLFSFPDYTLTPFEASSPLTPNDPLRSNQWYLNAIKAGAAREKGVFGQGVTVAVIDSGVNTGHLDFNAGNILPGRNVSDVPVYDEGGTQQTDENGNLLYTERTEAEQLDVTDANGHGTMTAGLIAAQAHNDLSIAGIADQVSLLPVKMVSENGVIQLSWMIEGLYYAAESGCDVISLSAGLALDSSVAEEADTIEALNAIMTELTETYNVIIVAAAGNDGIDGSTETAISYPAGCDDVIGVSSVTMSSDGAMVPANHSSKNASVWIAAPGGGAATNAAGDTITDTPVPYILSLVGTAAGTKNDYGTSYATPQVAAAVALIRDLWPDCPIDTVKTILMETAANPAEVNILTPSSGTASETNDGTEPQKISTAVGYGLLDIEAIMSYLSEKLPKYAMSEGCVRDENQNITESYLYIQNNTSDPLTLPTLYHARKTGGFLTSFAKIVTGVTVPAGSYGAYTYTDADDTATGDELFMWAEGLRPLAKKLTLR